jgi:hypothetical protein
VVVELGSPTWIVEVEAAFVVLLVVLIAAWTVVELLNVQALDELLPGAELDPDGQLMHVSAEVAAVALEYFPPSQSEQDAEPDAPLYLPALQLTQGTPSLPVKPLLHVQLLGSLLPEGEVDPNGQAVHCTAT